MFASPAHIYAAQPIHRLSLWFSALIGLAIVVAGVVLVYLGAKGGTSFKLFGNEFQSETVGAVGIFCGAVIIILNIRRIMKSLERLGALSD